MTKTPSKMRNLCRKAWLIACLLCIATTGLAVPTNPRPFTVTQPDGTTLQLRFIGDENYSYYATLDGMAVVQEGNAYYYASIGERGQLVSTGRLAHEATKRVLAEKNYITEHRDNLQRHISTTWKELIDLRNAQREEKMQARKVRQKVVGRPSTHIGKKRGIVILVNYADLTMKPSSTVQAWDDQFNQHGYSKNNHYGSVRDYFLDQSYQQLEIDFDVVGPYTVSQGWRYYGANREGTNSDVHPCQLVSEACKLADADINFKDYDWDGDGEVDQVFVVFAGYSAASGYSPEAIWPHEWHLDYGAYYKDGQGALRLDGVKIDNYALSSELLGTSGSTMDCIGTAVHEFSHCLGLPDFYDVDGNGTQCMDYWDVLDAGCYSGPGWKGEVPTGYTAYERHFAGWLQYDELTDPCKVEKLPNLGDEPRAYIHYNKGNKNEYFILENRQATGWFKYPVQAHGLFVYHVDYDKGQWENDRPNSDPQHPRMTFVPADKSFARQNTGQMVSDFFPGTNKVTSLTNTSHTNCYGVMFNKNSDGTFNTNMELTNIRELAGKISFTYNGGETAVKNKLKKLIEDVKALTEVPHVDMEDGATDVMLEALASAQATVDSSTTSTTSAEFQKAIETLKKSAVSYLFATNPTDTLQPYDITFTLVNPEVASNEGWKEELGNNGFVYANNCGAYTNIKYNLSQSTAKMPKGRFRATVQAFQQTGNATETLTNAVNASFYARTKTMRVKNIADDALTSKKSTSDQQLGNGLYAPKNQAGANVFFRNGMYLNSLEFENTSTTGTTIKLGMRCTQAKEGYWTCFTNFKLYFLGDPEAVIDGGAGTDAIHTVSSEGKSSDTYDLMGRKVNDSKMRSGIYIKAGKAILVK